MAATLSGFTVFFLELSLSAVLRAEEHRMMRNVDSMLLQCLVYPASGGIGKKSMRLASG